MILVPILLALGVYTYLIFRFARKTAVNEADERDLGRFRTQYQTKRGSRDVIGIGYVTYNLLSTDEGRTWYALGKNREVLGPVNDVYPGLLEGITAWDEMQKREAAGTFDLASSASDRELLMSAVPGLKIEVVGE